MLCSSLLHSINIFTQWMYSFEQICAVLCMQSSIIILLNHTYIKQNWLFTIATLRMRLHLVYDTNYLANNTLQNLTDMIVPMTMPLILCIVL